MANAEMSTVLDYLQRLGTGDVERLTDCQLLERFTEHEDQGAFGVLVRRHGALVLSVCWRLLRHAQDAEDAFQATFLVLARKSGSVNWRESVAGWLHEVACRVAAEARGKTIRRKTRETLMETIPDVPFIPPAHDGELSAVLDEELRRLPEQYRLPLVLCCLEGRTREEAAAQLGWTPGMVKGRLERGRRLLARRLARRGVPEVATAGAMLPVLTCQASVPPALVGKTLQLASGFISGKVSLATATAVRWAESVLRSIAPTHVVLVAATLLVFALAGSAAALLANREPEQIPNREALLSPPVPQPAPAAPKDVVTVRLDRPVRVAVFTRDSKQFATASFDGTVRVWDAATGKAIRRWELDGLVSALAVSPDGEMLVAGTDRGEVVAWNLAGGKELFRQPTRQRNVYQLAFSPDGKLLASANHEGTVSLWDKTGADVLTLVGHTGRVWGVCFSLDGTTLASAGEDGTLRWWDPIAGREQGQVKAHSDYTCAVAYSPDGKELASIGFDGRLRLWTAGTGKEKWTRDVPSGPSLAFTPNGKHLATTDRTGTLHVWDGMTGKKLSSVKGHDGQAHYVAVAPDGKRLVTAGEDGTAHVWALDSQ